MLCDGNAEMQHILHKRFITWAIIPGEEIEYIKWTRVLAKIDSSTEARVLVRSPTCKYGGRHKQLKMHDKSVDLLSKKL